MGHPLRTLRIVFLAHTLVAIFFCPFSSAQQCTLPSKIFLPQPDTIQSTGLGSYVDVDNGYMIVGTPYNDSLQVYAGLAYVYKLNALNQWVRIAKLAPADPAKYTNFGMGVSIAGNSIAIFGVEYNDAGDRMGKIYMFEKPSTGDWVNSTENYVIKNSTGFAANTFGEFELAGDELIAIANINTVTKLQVYSKISGTYSLTQTIDPPSNTGGGYYSWSLALGNDFFAIGSSQYYNADGSNGVVLVYEKSGAYKTTPAILRSSLQTNSNWQGFGVGLTAYQSTLFVAGVNSASSYNQTYYIFERPASGWVDSQQAPIMESPGSSYYYFQMVANQNYLFITNPDFKSVRGFKKPGTGWSSSATTFLIDNLPADKTAVGNQISLDGSHLIIGCPARYLIFNAVVGEDLIADYYSPLEEWDASGLQAQQVIREITKGASDDFFGVSMDANSTYLAVGASQDSKKGMDAGAVYLYKIPASSEAPEKIYSPDPENYSAFGNAVALGDSVLFVAAPFKDSLGVDHKPVFYSIGKVYVYRLGVNGWKYHSQIIAPGIHSQVTFGQHVSYHKGYVAITQFYSGDSEEVGSVHLYKENAQGKFIYLATLQPSIPLRADFFGRSVIMNDSLIVVGTGNFAVNSDYRMKVFIYKKKGEWKSGTEDARLSASDTGWSDRFGFSIAMYEDYIVVGAPSAPGFDPRPIPRNYIIPGAAYIYKRPPGGWKGDILEIAKITPSDPVEMENFGYSVALDHNDLFIGAPSNILRYNYTDNLTNNDNSLKPGKIYHYKKLNGKDWASTNQETRQLMSFEPEYLDGYAHQLLVTDRYLYVSALLDDNASGFRAGSVQTMMQLPVIDSIKPLCTTTTPVKLKAFPSRDGAWTGDGINAANKTFSPSVAGPGPHTLTYTVAGCQASTTVNVIFDDFTVLEESAAEQTKCIGQPTALVYNSNEDALNYQWFYKNTAAGSYQKIDELKKQIAVVQPGYYEVRVSRAICPSRKEDFKISDEALVKIQINPVDVFCADHTEALQATPPLGNWVGDGISSNGIFDSSNLPDGAHKETYDLITPAGCHYKDSLTIIIDRLKAPALIFNNEKICGVQPVILKLNNVDTGTTVEWLDGSHNPIPGQSSATLQVRAPGNYSAIVTKLTCSASVPPVTVEAQRDSLFVPNVFTPNGDSHNDFFEIRSEGLESLDLTVFNRYGKEVYHTNDLAFQWSGNNVSPGVYFWRAAYTTCSQGAKEQKGWVQVID